MAKYKINSFSANLERKVQNIEKNTPITITEDFFSIFYIFFSIYAENEFILYLTINFYLGIKNPILGIFSRKFTRMYSFYI